MAVELQGGQVRHIRIGASAIVLRDHLPEVFQAARKKFTGLKLSLREGFPVQLEQLLQNDEIDLAFTLIERKIPAGVQSLTLLELPLVLLIPRKTALSNQRKNFESATKIDGKPLICLPAAESSSRKIFADDIAKAPRGTWFPRPLKASSDRIDRSLPPPTTWSIGVSIANSSKNNTSPKVRMLPLIRIFISSSSAAAMWRGRKKVAVD